MTPLTAVITGAGGGIGSALCREFRRAGYFVIGTDVRCVTADVDAFIEADLALLVQGTGDGENIVSKVRGALPSKSLTVLINNAAVQLLDTIEGMTLATWRTTLEINLLAPFFLTQGLLPELKDGEGSVINIASIHAELTKSGFSAYATSKAALVSLTRSLAIELGGQVRVNAICPAAIETSMLRAGFRDCPEMLKRLALIHPAGVIGSPDEAARAALFLADKANRFLTGSVLGLHGGIAGRLYDVV